MDSLAKLAENLVAETKKFSGRIKTEEDLRIGFEKLLEPVLKELGVKPKPQYEKSIYNAGRTDALHGQVVIEYEPPYAFRSARAVEHARDQLIAYIQGLSATERETLFLFETKFIGVGFDGGKIFFVRYAGDTLKARRELKAEDFILAGPYEFSAQSARTLLTHLRALARLPLTAENLADKFGPKSELAPKAVSAFANALEHWGDQSAQTHIRTFFDEWKRLFGIVYGEQFSGHQATEAETLSKLYKVGKETDFQELLFSVHTYFAFLMKLIAAELLTLREASFTSSLAAQLAHIPDDELKRQLEDIENGGIYAQKGITNFLEGDFFRWYLDAFDSPELKDVIREIARGLSEFEPATSTLNPALTRDLLKKLYQYLVPQEVRHRLGEYYTPDWLAELLLDEIGYDGNNLKRVLDPACGSGTFLVLTIQRAISWGFEHKRPPLEIAKSIKANIWGFDLNPLAVIAARTNYLFAVGDLVHELKNIEIPIYLADSVLNPTKTWGALFDESHVGIPTSVGRFKVPRIWVEQKFLMSKAAPLIEMMAKNRFTPDEALEYFKKEGLVFPPHENVVKNFYSEILKLEMQNRNGIWARFLKNAFAPIAAEKFDFVVGNPPWILWEYLSKDYRVATQNLWENYGLTKISQSRNVLARARRDFSTLFVYAAADYYLKDGAKLGFLITQEIFKSKGAAEGFRRFQLGEGKYLRVLKAHDLASIQPFEGATNKTAAIILKKGEKTEYPVPYIVWTKKKGVGKIVTDTPLEEVLPLLSKKRLIAKPMGLDVGAWKTQATDLMGLESIEGKNNYKATIGVNTDPYGVFWLEVKTVLSNGNLLVSNLPEMGKTKITKVEKTVEPDLVYPALRGADIKRWGGTCQIYTLITHPASQIPYSLEIMRKNWPYTFAYLTEFKEILMQGSLYRHFHRAADNPFYGQRNVNKDTFVRYKVVWKIMANDLIASVVSQFKTSFGYKDLIPFKTTAFIATSSEAEAHYLCAIINSKPVRDFIKSFSSAGRGFGTPSVMEYVGIPRFDPQNPLHQKLTAISKKCHELKAEGKTTAGGKEKEIEKLERENDELVKKLFPASNRKQ